MTHPSMDPPEIPPRVILVDGTCVFCNRLASFILKHDRAGLFHFAHLQSQFARDALARNGREPDIDSVYLLMDGGTDAPRLLVDGEAGREIWPRLFVLAGVIRILPLPLLNVFYRLFARYRYRLFGRYDACHVPTLEERGRLISS